MLERLFQEIAIAIGVVVLVTGLAAEWPTGVKKILAPLPTRARPLVIIAAGAGALRFGLLALADWPLRPWPIPSIVVWAAFGAGAGLMLRSGQGRCHARARDGAMVGAAGAALAFVVIRIAAAYSAETRGLATAFAFAGLAGSLWLWLMRTDSLRSAAARYGLTNAGDAAAVLKVAGFGGTVAATATASVGKGAPVWVIVVASLLPLRDFMFSTRTGRSFFDTPIGRPLFDWGTLIALLPDALAEPVRDRPVLAARLAGIPAGVGVISAWWFITMAGFLLEDKSLGLTLGTSAGLQPLDQAGWALGIFFLGSIAARFVLRKLFLWLALMGTVAMALIALTSSVNVIRVAAVLLGFSAIAAPIGVVALLGTTDRAKVSATWGGTWLTTAFVVQGAELAVAWVWSWRAAAVLHLVLLPLTALLFLVLPSLPHSSENPLTVWWRTLKLLRTGRVRRGTIVWFLSGAMQGVVGAIYSPLLGERGVAELAWLPLFGVLIGALPTVLWGRWAARSPREALVWTAIVSALTYVPGILLFGIPWWLAFAGNVLILVIVLFLQVTLMEIGTSGTTAVGPAVLLPAAAAEENALTQTWKQAGAAVFGFAASWLLGLELAPHAGLAPNLLGAVAGAVLVAFTLLVPLQSHGSEPDATVAAGPPHQGETVPA